MSKGLQQPGEASEQEAREHDLSPSEPPEFSSGDAIASAWPHDEAAALGERGEEAGSSEDIDDAVPSAEDRVDAEPVEAFAPTVAVRRSSGRAIAIMALVLILFCLSAFGGAVGWLVYRGEDPFDYVPVPTIERLEARIGVLESGLAEARRTGRQALDREAGLRDGLDDLGQAVAALSADVAAEAPIDERQWRLAETAYLLRVANFRAGVENDRAGAEALLLAADELLREINDFGLMPVRERIAEARTALRISPAVDRTGLYLGLEVLGDQIAVLPLDRREYVPPPPGARHSHEQLPEESEEVATGWVVALRETVAGLVDFRVHRPNPVRTLSEPGEADFLRHNLALKLEQAQLALLRKDGEVWRLALEDALRWTRDYFDLEDPAVQGVLSELKRLTGERVEMPAPDLSAPHEALLRLRSRASFLGSSQRPAP